MRILKICLVSIMISLLSVAIAGDEKQTIFADSETQNNLQSILSGEHRDPKNVGRDKYRHPQETLEFFGIKPEMTVVELWPGGGWYTEVLAPFVKGNGKFIAAGFTKDPEVAEDANERAKKIRKYQAETQQKYEKKLAAEKSVYGDINFVEFMPPKTLSLGAEDSVDMILSFRNTHNWTRDKVADQVFTAAFKTLKPGGVFGLVQHRAKQGADPFEQSRVGYVPEEYVIEIAKKAGFVLAAKSEINANPKDTKEYEQGVWTLPPVLALKDKDKEKYLAIGESDRMTLKFVKPKG